MHAPFTAELIVDRYLNGVRIDSFLIRHFRNYTSWRMQRIVRAGAVQVNGATVELSQRVFRGQTVTVRLVEPPDKLLEKLPLPLEVLFEDAWFLVINKPAGLIAHPGGIYQTNTLVNAVQHYLDRQTPLRGLLRPGIVHRLDRQTSGVMVVPKEHLSHRHLGIQFENERVSKTYIALVEGAVRKDTGTIEYPLGFAPGGRNILASAKANALEARPAKTRYEVIERFGSHTLVLAKPATGRLHQIRVHFAEIGHPLVADEFYGPFGEIKPPRVPPSTNGDEVEEPETSIDPSGLMNRHALHAHRLAFSHPISGDWMEFEAPLPEDFQDAITRLRESRT